MDRYLRSRIDCTATYDENVLVLANGCVIFDVDWTDDCCLCLEIQFLAQVSPALQGKSWKKTLLSRHENYFPDTKTGSHCVIQHCQEDKACTLCC